MVVAISLETCGNASKGRMCFSYIIKDLVGDEEPAHKKAQDKDKYFYESVLISKIEISLYQTINLIRKGIKSKV